MVSTIVCTPVKPEFAVDMEVSMASAKGSTLLRSTDGSPRKMSLTKINFKDLVAAEFEGIEEQYIKRFKGRLNYQSVL